MKLGFSKTAISMIALLSLGGCGTINAWTSAKTTVLEQDAAGAIKNKEKIDDDYLKSLQVGACDVTWGAVSRSTAAMQFVNEGCPIQNVAKVTVSNGTVQLAMPNTVPLNHQAAPVMAPAPVQTGLSDADLQRMAVMFAQALATAKASQPTVMLAPRPVAKPLPTKKTPIVSPPDAKVVAPVAPTPAPMPISMPKPMTSLLSPPSTGLGK